MAGFPGRGGMNMFPNIANLNAIPSDYDIAMQQQRQQHRQQQDSYNMQADLDLFTNTQFFDFDMAEVLPTQSPTAFNDNDPFSVNQPMNYFDGYQNLHNYAHNAAKSKPLLPSNGTALPAISAHTPPIQPHPQLQYQQKRRHSQQSSQLPSQQPSAINSPSSSTATPVPDKRKFESLVEPSSTENLEEAARAAAEEDKRRRNTAASARFRVKKKQREAALEKATKDMTDRASYLENRVTQLEMENKLLKDLITEKSGKEVNFAELVRDLEASMEGDVEKLTLKKGVGTGDKSVVKSEA